MPKTPLPRIIGMNQLGDETSLANDEFSAMYVRQATNIDIDKQGNINRRKGARLLTVGSGYHSLYSSSRTWLMACLRNELGVYNPDTAVFTPLVTMEDAYRTSFTELNRNLYAVNPSFSCMFLPGQVAAKPIGVPLPDIEPEFYITSSGDFEEGTYGVAYTVIDLDGEESGLSEITFLELEAGQGIGGNLFTIQTDYKYRIYCSTANGDQLRQAIEFDADVVSIEILTPEQGRLAETQGLEPPPFGHIIRSFNSRLLIAAPDGNIHFTEAFRPHLYHPTNFVSVSGFPTMVEAVEDGVFVGDQNGVHFFQGQDPSSWAARTASSERVVYNTSTTLSGAYFEGDIANFDEVALWLTHSGYQIGLPNGEIIRLNKEQIKTPDYVLGCTAVLISDGRKQVVTPVNSNEAASAEVALDSTILV